MLTSFRLPIDSLGLLVCSLEISGNGVRWSTRPVQAQKVFMLQRVIWPRHVFQYFKTRFVSIFREGPWQVDKFVQKFKEDNGLSQQTSDQRPTINSQEQPGRATGLDQSPTPSVPSGGLVSVKEGSPSSSSRPSSRRVIHSVTPVPWSPDFEEQIEEQTRLSEMKLAFPRGTLNCVGRIQVFGELGLAVCDVWAAYDPKSSQLLWTTMTVIRIAPNELAYPRRASDQARPSLSNR